MPTYTYSCQSCGVRFDKYQKFAEKPLTRCPECRKGQLRRLVQSPAIVFKGSGWYATDHRSASGAAAAKEKKSEPGAAAEKTESKPAQKETATTTPKSED